MEERVRAKDIIERIRQSMLGGLEETYKVTYAPARYIVHLHPGDYDGLQGFFSKIREGALNALADDLAELNQGTQAQVSGLVGVFNRLGIRQTEEMRYELAGAVWEVEFLADNSEEIAPGDMAIESLLDVDSQAEEYSGGGKTIRVVERHTESGTSRSREVLKSEAAPARIYARISYEDLKRKDTFKMTKPLVRIGRGGSTYLVDLVLVALPDVSREHVHIRYNETQRRFEIKDVSTLGTKVNGAPINSSLAVDPVTQNKKDQDRWEPLPAQARISLADKLFLEFAAVEPL